MIKTKFMTPIEKQELITKAMTSQAHQTLLFDELDRLERLIKDYEVVLESVSSIIGRKSYKTPMFKKELES